MSESEGFRQETEGKTAIITGASRGMGRAAAILFGAPWRQGRGQLPEDKEAADQVVSKIKELGGKAIAVTGRHRQDLPTSPT